MLAPQSERLPAGPLLDICLQSRNLYGEWVKGVERGAREASLGVAPKNNRFNNRYRGMARGEMYTGEGAKYLWDLTNDDETHSFDGRSSSPLEPWETGFHSTGGFLAPAFAGDAVATWSPQPNSGKSYWLDDIQVRELEPRLHPNVVGGWWFPEDASVDARRLTCSLRAACVGAGVQMNFGSEWEVKSLEMSKGTCDGVHLANGKIYSPKSIIVANGSWMRHLLPLPVTPHKGQSFSLRMPTNAPPLLSRVLFAQDTYIVPKADGRIIVGATVEPGRFDGDVTPEGLMHCLSEATRLVPGLGELPIEETWAGLRPTTPDKCPILGATEQWDNVFIAGGYWRNGVLLAPKTGQLIGDLIVNDGDATKLPEEDQALLNAFSWERFTTPGGGKALAANARYAATFYPVHKRSTDGVAVSVGTELGFYEGAAAAKGDREQDRKSMFGISAEEEDVLERAAGLGVGDAKAFSFGDEGDGWMVKGHKKASLDDGHESEDASMAQTTSVDADVDAFTVGVIEEDTAETVEETLASDNLPSIYEKIKANKARLSESIEMSEDPTEKRADPGFRIHHIDSKTGETTEVPPFTSPGEFFQMKAEANLPMKPSEEESSDNISSDANVEANEQTTFDGYTAIRQAYGQGTTAEETQAATRRARMNNRGKTSEIDETQIGAMYMADTAETTGDLSSVYDKIRSNKAKASHNIEMGDSGDIGRPELDFTIYHVDSKTEEVRAVPPYTSPGEFLDSIEKQKTSGQEAAVNSSNATNHPDAPDNTAQDKTIETKSEESDSELIDDGSDEKTYDGYQAIQTANSAPSREEELRRMKEIRIANRAMASSIMGDSL